MQINNMVLWYRPDTIQLDESNFVLGYTDASPAGNNSVYLDTSYLTKAGQYIKEDGTILPTSTWATGSSWYFKNMYTGCHLEGDFTIIVVGLASLGLNYGFNAHVLSGQGYLEGKTHGLGTANYENRGDFQIGDGSWWGVRGTQFAGGTGRYIQPESNFPWEYPPNGLPQSAPNVHIHGIVKSGSTFTYRKPQADGANGSAPDSTSVVGPVPEGFTKWGEVIFAGELIGTSNDPLGMLPFLEIVVFDRALSQEEIEYVEGYLSYKYDATDYLNYTHPYKTVAPVGTLEAVTGDTGGGSGGGVGVGLISKENPSIARRQVMNMTMSKAAMETASGVPQAEWKRVLALYTSEGNPKAVVSFKHSQESAPGRFRSKAESAASYTLSKVIIIKTDSTFTVVDRSELDSPESMDVEVT